MTVTDTVFPQTGDADYAENFATWLGRGNITDFVETGLEFTVNYTDNTLSITQGKAFVVVDEQTISSTGETRLVLDYAVTLDGESGVSLNASEDNNLVYVNPNIGVNDDPTFEIETDPDAAGTGWLHIGTVDTVNETYEYHNRDPDADFATLSARETLDLPTYSDPADASAAESSTIYIDGSGQTDPGIYVYDGNEYIAAGFRELSKLNDVTGVEGITSNTSGNRPSAGTEGRIYIEENNERILRDSGSSWVEIGTNPSNISTTDLGFDVTTQSELDSHIAVSDAHHTRPTAGNFLEDDGTDTFGVQIGFGLEDDGSGNIRIDEDTSFEFSSSQVINAPLTLGGELDMSNNDIIDPDRVETGGGGNDRIAIRDASNLNNIATFREGGEVEINSGDLTDGSSVIFDQSNTHVPLNILESTTLTINAGNGLKNGGSVSLDGSTTIDVEPAEFAGTYLSDDGSDNLTVNIGEGLEGDGAGNIRLNRDYDFTFTSAVDFTNGLDVDGDITDGAQVIWSSANQEVPDSAIGLIDNSTLSNSSVTVTAGTGLSGGGSISLGGSITINISDVINANRSSDSRLVLPVGTDKYAV